MNNFIGFKENILVEYEVLGEYAYYVKVKKIPFNNEATFATFSSLEICLLIYLKRYWELSSCEY